MAQLFTVHATNPQPRLIRQAAAMLRDGAVIAYPTDSSYALGCQLGDTAAAKRILAIRGLGDAHHLTLVCRDLADAGRLARLSNWQFKVARQGIPGPFTFVLPASRELPRRLQHPKRSTVGIRVPAHPVVQALLVELGEPILSSTMILPGDAVPLNDAATIRDRLQGMIDLVIDSGPCPGVATTVLDLVFDPPVVVRQGGGDPARLGLA